MEEKGWVEEGEWVEKEGSEEMVERELFKWEDVGKTDGEKVDGEKEDEGVLGDEKKHFLASLALEFLAGEAVLAG